MPLVDPWTCRYIFSRNLQQHIEDTLYFFRISLTADGPQRTRLPVPRTATLSSCLWSRSVLPSHAFCYGSQNKRPDFVKNRTFLSTPRLPLNSPTRAKKADHEHVFFLNRFLTYADVKNPARGHKVEKHHPEGQNVRRTLHTIRKRQLGTKNTRKKRHVQIN